MSECICCGDRLLRQISARRMYWFCPTCRQEMPSAHTTYISQTTKQAISLSIPRKKPVSRVNLG